MFADNTDFYPTPRHIARRIIGTTLIGELVKQKELIIRALHDAINWQDSLIDCMKGCTSASDVAARERYEYLASSYRKLFTKMSGRSFDPPPYAGETISVYELLKQPKENQQ